MLGGRLVAGRREDRQAGVPADALPVVVALRGSEDLRAGARASDDDEREGEGPLSLDPSPRPACAVVLELKLPARRRRRGGELDAGRRLHLERDRCVRRPLVRHLERHRRLHVRIDERGSHRHVRQGAPGQQEGGARDSGDEEPPTMRVP